MGGIFFAANRDRVNVWKRGDRNYLRGRMQSRARQTFARDTRVHIHSAGFLPTDTLFDSRTVRLMFFVICQPAPDTATKVGSHVVR